MNIPEKVIITDIEGKEYELLLSSRAMYRLEKYAEDQKSGGLKEVYEAKPFQTACRALVESLKDKSVVGEDEEEFLAKFRAKDMLAAVNTLFEEFTESNPTGAEPRKARAKQSTNAG